MPRLLPSEQEQRATEAIEKFEEEGSLTIYEPCDCGDQIRHCNGGNYHQIIYLKEDKEKIFVKWSDTCELKPPAEWEELKGDYEALIQAHADWL